MRMACLIQSERGDRLPKRSGLTLPLLAVLALWCCGCPSVGTWPTQAPVREMIEARTQRPYLLYVPSTYSDGIAWPLVVACHGTWPYDVARRQMQEWAQFAEDRGILILAPELVGVMGDFPPPPEKQIARQREDERAILAMVSAVKRKYNVAEEQVFMTGWSAGSYAILHAGLRNPDVFRALAVRQGTFDERFMDVPQERLDTWQRILVIYGMVDFLRDQSKEMIAWLRDRGLTVQEKEIPGSHRRIDPKLPWRYFREVVKKRPWIRLRAQVVDSYEPLVVRFDVDTVPPAVGQKWFFGDGETSREAAPLHTYAEPGRYDVRVNVALKKGKVYSRKRVIRVGQF